MFLALDPGFPSSSCVLPIGNLTSQWWGNHYLSKLDHFAKRMLKVQHYLRYMDDIALLADDARQLEAARRAGRPPREVIMCLGHRVWQAGVAQTQATLHRIAAYGGSLRLVGLGPPGAPPLDPAHHAGAPRINPGMRLLPPGNP